MFEMVIAGSDFDSSALATGGANSLTFDVVTELLDDLAERQLCDDLTLDDTMKESLVLARRGQGVFRKNVERMERICRLTGVTNPALLIASHIKPVARFVARLTSGLMARTVYCSRPTPIISSIGVIYPLMPTARFSFLHALTTQIYGGWASGL
ncbi:MAG: hypothetical protein WDN69_29835 [Aliidongia sp.]